jgi:hypothetical protein
MSKVKSITALIITLLMTMLLCTSVSAADLNIVTYDNSKIKVEGTCTTSDQVQVIVFDANNQPLYFATVDVVDNAFSKTLDASFDLIQESTYTVKVADYNGSNLSKKTFVVSSSSDNGDTTVNVNAETTQTGDYSNMVLWITALFVSGGVFTILIIIKKRKRSLSIK